MAKKKNLKESDIVDFYMEHVLKHDKQPKSVFSFAESYNFDESLFYSYFTNFEALEQHIFKVFFDNTVSLLSQSEDYINFDARNKLLSFYYTFFEILTANRTYVVCVLENKEYNLKKLRVLSQLKQSFTNYINHLDIKTVDLKQDTIDNVLNKTLLESAWFQLLVTLKFWLDDTSNSFEKTDVFIEKSVNTSFDIIDIKALKSIIDFGKFLFKEKMQSH